MAFTVEWGSGIEMGAVPVLSANRLNATADAVTVKTGVYSLKLVGSSTVGAGYVYWTRSGNYLDVGAWVNPRGTPTYPIRIELILNNADIVDVRYEDDRWNAYVKAVKVATGTIITTAQTWQHVQVRFYIADSGYIKTKIDGVADIDYSGDTLPSGAASIATFRLRQSGGAVQFISYFDDIVFGTGDWPGDIRFDRIVPDSDDTAEWTPSAGGDNYALVDEIPPSDADYVTGGSVPTVTDKYTLSDWSGTAKTPQFVVAWARAQKDTAGTIQLDLGVDSNGTEDTTGGEDISTTYEYYDHISVLNPDGDVAWDEAAIDALKVVIRTA